MMAPLPVILMFAAAVLPQPRDGVDAPAGVARIRREAEALRPLVTSELAREFLRATADLPAVSPRTLYRDARRGSYLAEPEVTPLGAERRRALVPLTLDESFYYYTKYGSPLAYARPLELLARAGVHDVAGRKVLDFGYGTVGHLRLLAGLGADVTGVDVDPLLRALYSAVGDQGPVKGRTGRQGRITLVDGHFPANEAVRAAVGTGYDLIASKNTLKMGYIHPAEPVDDRLRVDLGVDDAGFVRALYSALRPGGRVLIYNICPAPSPPGQPYKPWADGRCPFPKAVWESAGFQIIAFDREDSEAAREVAHALGWDRGDTPIDLKADLFATYSLMRKPPGE
jgi:SAM-dependent methyltransferase